MTKQLFVELTDKSRAPSMLSQTTYQIPRLKYNRGSINVISVHFTLADGIILTGSHACSTKTSSIEFINSQMETITNDLPGYGINVNGATGDYSDIDYGVTYG